VEEDSLDGRRVSQEGEASSPPPQAVKEAAAPHRCGRGTGVSLPERSLAPPFLGAGRGNGHTGTVWSPCWAEEAQISDNDYSRMETFRPCIHDALRRAGSTLPCASPSGVFLASNTLDPTMASSPSPELRTASVRASGYTTTGV